MDTISGGKENDIYILDNAQDRVFEKDDEGIDRIQVGSTFALSRDFEDMERLEGGDFDGAGRSGANLLIGNSGANTMKGGGGDDLDGGDGIDFFHIGSADGSDWIGLDRIGY